MEIMINQKQKDNVEGFKYLVSMIRKNVRCKFEIASRILQHPARRKLMSPANYNLRKKLALCYICIISFYGTEIWTFGKWIRNTLKV
jgi:hypothetical protein